MIAPRGQDKLIMEANEHLIGEKDHVIGLHQKHVAEMTKAGQSWLDSHGTDGSTFLDTSSLFRSPLPLQVETAKSFDGVESREFRQVGQSVVGLQATMLAECIHCLFQISDSGVLMK